MSWVRICSSYLDNAIFKKTSLIPVISLLFLTYYKYYFYNSSISHQALGRLC